MIDSDLPVDEGRKAYFNKIHYDDNPYPEEVWRNNEWWLGWKWAEEGDCGFDWKAGVFS